MTLRVPLGDLAAKHDDERHASRAVLPDRPRSERDATPPPRKEPDR
jgi:hypothetical protein